MKKILANILCVNESEIEDYQFKGDNYSLSTDDGFNNSKNKIVYGEVFEPMYKVILKRDTPKYVELEQIIDVLATLLP